MKKFLLVLFTFIGLGFWSVNAQTIASIDFNYANGAALNANGWTIFSGTTTFILVGTNNGLVYNGYSGTGGIMGVAEGNAAIVSGTGEDLGYAFTNQTSGIIYVSFLYQLTSANASGDYGFGIAASTGSVFNFRLYAKTSGAGYVLGNSVVGGTASYGSTVLNFNQTYLITMKCNIASSGGLTTWVNSSGTPTSEAAAGAYYCAAIGTISTLSAGKVLLRQSASTPVAIVDDIRIASAWSDALPVELKSLTANASGNNVKLNWNTATEQNNLGFEVERSLNVAEKNWTKVGFVAGNGTTNKPNTYSYTDGNVNAGSYVYRLKQVDKDGAFKYSSFVNVDVTAPSHFALEQNYPNPFNPSTVISYTLPTESNVSLKVFNALGQEVKNLESGVRASGSHTFNLNASELTSGIYYYTLKATSTDGKSNYSQTKKMMLVK